MTTVLFFASLILFAAVNAFLWLVEILAAIAKTMVEYLLSRPHNLKKSYHDVRVLFTKLLQKVSFAMISPKKEYSKRYSRRSVDAHFDKQIKRSVDNYLNHKYQHHK